MARFPIANPLLVFREDGEGGLLFNPDTGQITILNETAAFIYRQLDGHHTVEQILESLLADYNIPDLKEAKSDLDTILQQMQEAEAIGFTERD